MPCRSSMNSRLATTVPFADYSGHPIKVATTATTKRVDDRKKQATPHRTGVHENGRQQKKKKVDREKYFFRLSSADLTRCDNVPFRSIARRVISFSSA